MNIYIIRYASVFIQRNVEIHSDQYLFARYVYILYGLLIH